MSEHPRPAPLRLLVAATAALLLTTGCGRQSDAPPTATLTIGELLGGSDTLHARAVAQRAFAFPGDHGPHPGYRTEWWYFTGNVTADDGRELGYQLTFFRSALMDSASYAAISAGDRSEWRGRHAYMAHFAVTDGSAGEFHAAEKFARGAIGLAGARIGVEGAEIGADSPGSGAERPGSGAESPENADAGAASDARLRVWLEDWSAESLASATFPLRLRASSDEIAIDLVVERGKPIVLQGDRGLSRKGPEPGNASYYYSLTRMPTRGSISTPAGTSNVTGLSWLDREWSTSALSPGVAGWDWLSLQLNDSTELMMYRLRRSGGAVDPFSAATFVAADGSTRGFAADEFVMSPTSEWRSADGVAYPVAWRIEIPAIDLALDVAAPVEDQELELAVRYWEGMVRAHGSRADRRITGRGYLEMTGYGADAPDRAASLPHAGSAAERGR